MSSSDEQSLLERVRQYDETAIAEIYDRYSSRIYNYILHRLGDAALAEDLTATVFVHMLKAIRTSTAWRVSFSGWLYRIAHNLVVDHYRSRPQGEELTLDERLIASESDPAHSIDQSLAMQQLRWALGYLTEDQSQVIVLKFIEELSNAEVAYILGKSEGAVKSLQFRALAALRRLMSTDEIAG